MLKKTVTYTDYNGVERTEDFYFNLTRSELIEMHLTTEGGMDEKINSIINAKSQPELEKLFKEILLKSYGKKSPDGRLFMKNDEIRAEFEASPVYDELYMKLFTDENAAADFVNGVIPQVQPKANPAMQMAATANAAPALTLG